MHVFSTVLMDNPAGLIRPSAMLIPQGFYYSLFLAVRTRTWKT